MCQLSEFRVVTGLLNIDTGITLNVVFVIETTKNYNAFCDLTQSIGLALLPCISSHFAISGHEPMQLNNIAFFSCPFLRGSPNSDSKVLTIILFP